MAEENKREKAREYFKKFGMSYKDIKLADFYILLAIIADEIEIYSKEKADPNVHGISTMRISDDRKRYLPHFEASGDGTLRQAQIKVDSHYFEGREAITFNQDGFIGFAGWADDDNVDPFVIGFMRFVLYLAHKKQFNNNVWTIIRDI